MNRLLISLLATSSFLLFAGLAQAATRVTWHGHAAFEIVTPKGKVLMIDPWLKNPMNPAAKDGAKDGKDPVAEVKKLDYILVTHAHFDHVGDSVALGKKTKARLVTNFELGNNMVHELGFPEDQIGFDTLINIGGQTQIAEGEVTVQMVPAIHSSGFAPGEGKEFIYGGNPAGFVLKIAGGPTIYHSGDTAYYSDMRLIGDMSPDLALINIGGHFGMEPPMAAQAAAATRAKLVVPHHFQTFPVLTQDAEPFVKMVKSKGLKAYVMKPGETLVFEGKNLKK